MKEKSLEMKYDQRFFYVNSCYSEQLDFEYQR
jgi:hypothetical protein